MNKLDRLAPNWLIMKINNRAYLRGCHVIQGRVIDLGCGTAPYKVDILEKADEYIGVDWHGSLHDQGNVDVFADLSERLPFPDHSADTVVAFQVMEHLPEPAFFLSECHRILRPGGALFLTVPFMWEVHEAPHDYHRFTRYGLEYLLKKTGFSQSEIRETTGFWQTSCLKFNYHTTRWAGGVRRFFWAPIWFLGQLVAPLLDRLDGHPQETASYSVIARKPGKGVVSGDP